MSNPIGTILAILAVALLLGAVIAVSLGEHMVGGVGFLTATFVIYLRETRA